MKDETSLIIKNNQLESPLKYKDRASDVTVDSEYYRLSEISISPKLFEQSPTPENNSHYRKFFQQKTKQQEISNGLHQKAIKWILSFCWTRNYSEDILWFAIGYYYAYISSNVLKKQKLTLLLLSVINLSLKLYSPHQTLSLTAMKNILGNKWEINQFQQVQSEMILLLGFDLYFPIVLDMIYTCKLNEQQIAKTQFIYQLLFFKNYQPAFNQLLVEEILALVKFPSQQSYLKEEIINLGLNMKTLQIVNKKFQSKFHVEDFLKEISIEF